MDSLRDLHDLSSALISEYREHFNGNDLMLPSEFKNTVQSIDGCDIIYNKYSAVLTTKAGLKIYLPNQWFYIASYFTDYYNELMKYRGIAMTIFSSERLKELNGKQLTNEEEIHLKSTNYSDYDKSLIKNFVTNYDWWRGGKTINRQDFYVSPILSYANLVNASQSYVADLCAYLATHADLSNILRNSSASGDGQEQYNVTIPLEKEIKLNYNKYLTALHTKPLLLLAGISGTGKSRLVKELAFMTCPRDGELDKEKSEPGNYCLIDVKPNWHDSSELLGYYSNISGRYEVTPFMRFVYKASQHLDVPYFVCLDEMNLAPVEQYFAEFLSKLETRKIKDGIMQPVTLIDKGIFSKCELYKVKQSNTDGDPEKRENYYSPADEMLMTHVKEHGLELPYNLYVIGTVNMDDTTHQFSRKVIDRAFTIEMNGGKLEDMFDKADTLEYRDEPIPFAVIKPNFTDAQSALDAMDKSPNTQDYADKIKTKVPAFLNAINEKLNTTPFKVSYRVENEMILYIASLIANDNSMDIDKAIGTASLAILLEKVLPRVEGDDKLLNKPLNELRGFVQQTFAGYDQETSDSETQKESLYQLVDNKLAEMQDKLRNSYFTSFFS
jgi:hypothetical protein